MANKHNHHHCECKHDNIKFCTKCKVPHCLDCGFEWVAKSPTYWYYSYPYTTTAGLYQTGKDITPQITCGTASVGNAVSAETFTTCAHS
jgi:hypothetical protein